MRNDPGRFSPAGVNQIAQVPVVMLDVGLPGANGLPFEPEESHVKSDFTLLGELVGSARVFGQKNANRWEKYRTGMHNRPAFPGRPQEGASS